MAEPSGLDLPSHSPREELANTLTHGLGLVLSLVGAIVLIVRAMATGDVWRIAGCGIFAVALIAVYAASTLSHLTQPPWRRTFRILDQGFIYLLIVGTYTPLAIEYLDSAWWWLFLSMMWTVALVGFVSKTWFAHRIDSVTVWSYVALGWMPVIAFAACLELFPPPALWLVLFGGLCYTGGVLFLVLDWRRFHFHAIWHLFVVAGSMCHFFAIFLFVASRP